MNTERIKKAIKFFRTFQTQSDNGIYRKSVLKFCDMVETELGLNIESAVEEVFGDVKTKSHEKQSV